MDTVVTTSRVKSPGAGWRATTVHSMSADIVSVKALWHPVARISLKAETARHLRFSHLLFQYLHTSIQYNFVLSLQMSCYEWSSLQYLSGAVTMASKSLTLFAKRMATVTALWLMYFQIHGIVRVIIARTSTCQQVLSKKHCFYATITLTEEHETFASSLVNAR